MKNKYLILLTIIITLIIIHLNNKGTYSYEDTSFDYNLFYKEDDNELANDIKKYISDIDYIIYNNSNYEVYNNLNDNYEFMVNFAIDYIDKYLDKFKDDIVYLDNYTYYDKYYHELSTNKYISIDKLYDITDKYFNMKDFVILNDNVHIVNNYIALTSNTYNESNLVIDNITLNKIDDYIIANITYMNSNTVYSYKFKNYNNILKLVNVGVN